MKSNSSDPPLVDAPCYCGTGHRLVDVAWCPSGLTRVGGPVDVRLRIKRMRKSESRADRTGPLSAVSASSGPRAFDFASCCLNKK